MTDPVVAAPTTEQLVAALAASLLPFAGPTGLAVAAVVPALQSLLDTFLDHTATNYSVADLVAIVAEGNTALSKLATDVAALKK